MYNRRRGRISTRFMRNFTPYFDNRSHFRPNSHFSHQNVDNYRSRRPNNANYGYRFRKSPVSTHDVENSNDFSVDNLDNDTKSLLVNFCPDDNSREIIIPQKPQMSDQTDTETANEKDVVLKPWDLRMRIHDRMAKKKLQYPNEVQESNFQEVISLSKQDHSHVAPVWSRISPPLETKQETENAEQESNAIISIDDESSSDGEIFVIIDESSGEEPQILTADEPLILTADEEPSGDRPQVATTAPDHDCSKSPAESSNQTDVMKDVAVPQVPCAQGDNKVSPEAGTSTDQGPVKIYTVSAEEAKDNCDPEWELLKLLQTDDDRYRAVRKRWKSIQVPDPFRNLTHHGYRQAHGGTRLCGHKRTMSQADPLSGSCDDQRPAKRQRIVGSCVGVFDTKIRGEELRFQQTARELLSEQHKNVFNLTRCQPANIWNPHMYSPNSLVTHEVRKCVSFFQSQIEMARIEHDKRIAKLSSHRQEVLQFYQFYSNLKNSEDETRNTALLTEQQLQAIEETDYMHSLYETYYNQ